MTAPVGGVGPHPNPELYAPPTLESFSFMWAHEAEDLVSALGEVLAYDGPPSNEAGAADGSLPSLREGGLALLAQRLGDSVPLGRLRLFRPLPNDCLVQVSGPMPRRVAPRPAAYTLEVAEATAPSRPASTAAASPVDTAAQTPVSEPSPPRAKRPRLSSWRRRKKKRLDAEAIASCPADFTALFTELLTPAQVR